MTSPDGGFYSAQDAEVDGREGANYIWQAQELRDALSEDDADLAIRIYGLDRGPNFRDPHHADASPASVLRLEDRPDILAERLGIEPGSLSDRLARINRALYETRAARRQPRLDDKIIASWNGMMMMGLGAVGQALDDPASITAAAKAGEFLLAKMRAPHGLLRTFRAGEAGTPAFLEDYAMVIAGLLALERAGPRHTSPIDQSDGAAPAPDESSYLSLARALADEARRLFGDSDGGYFDTRKEQTDLFVRPKTMHDGAIPAGSSVMLHNLIDLFELTRDHAYLDQSLACASSLSAAIAQSPISSINATRALLRLLAHGLDDQLAALGPAPARASELPADFTPVEVYASTDRIQVSEDNPAEFRVVIRIAEGYHITAADPGPGGTGLIPLRTHVIGGAGIAAYADYPEGTPYSADGTLRIYTGEVEFPIAVERDGAWRGTPLLALTFQPCTGSECLKPMTVELDVAIDQGPLGHTHSS
jgi:uncharacterized protein